MPLNRRRVFTGVAVYAAFFLSIAGIAAAYLAGSAALILAGYVLLLILPLSTLALCCRLFGTDAIRRDRGFDWRGYNASVRRMSIRTAMLLSAVLGGFLLVCVMVLSAFYSELRTGRAVIACLVIAWFCPFILCMMQGDARSGGGARGPDRNTEQR